MKSIKFFSKQKILILIFILTISFYPIFSYSLPVPGAYLDIIVITEGEEGSFPFHLKWLVERYDQERDEFIREWEDFQSFELNTENFRASYSTFIIFGTQYFLEQEELTGWRIENIQCFSDAPEIQFEYQTNKVIFLNWQIYSHITCIFKNVRSATRIPVMIVPGLIGTEMLKGDEKIWPNIKKLLSSYTDDFLDALQFNNNLLPVDYNIYSGEVISKELTLDYTKGLKDQFMGQGYIENETLFTFPYDWRYGISGKYHNGKTNVDLLKEKIEEIVAQTGVEKIDIIAHSMGGLLVKKYVMDNPFNHHIRKAVFVGVPNTGAVKTIKVFLQGDNFGILGLNDEEVKKIVQNMPAGYDLLPTKEYFNDNGSFLKTVNIDVGNLIFEEKSLNYEDFKNFLINEHSLNFLGVQNSENLHSSEFDNYDLRTAGVEVYSINGCKTGTIGQIIETRKKNIFGYTFIDYDVRNEISGDGTVPLASVENLPVDEDKIFYVLKADHGKLLSQEGVRQKIVNIITGSNLNIGSNIIDKNDLEQNPKKCQLTGILFLKHSPISIEVLDSDGNRAGIFQDGSIENEIPGADYQIWGESAFIFIPTDENQSYEINLKGEKEGYFTLKALRIVNNQIARKEIFSNLPVNENLKGRIDLSRGNVKLLLDTNSDGFIDQSIEPHSIVEEANINDFLPPISTSVIKGEKGESGFYRSDVLVEIKTKDENSGVLSISYNLDNKGFQKIIGDTAILNVSSEGEHTIVFFSTDKAGNNEPEKIIRFTIDRSPPELILEFDLQSKDLKFTPQDENDVKLIDKDNLIILTDKAGNTTEIIFKDKNRKNLMKAEIKSIKYNGKNADISKNLFSFVWFYDKKGNLKNLIQHVKSKGDYNILAVYDGRNTTIIGKDKKGLINETFNGLKTIKVYTAKGNFFWVF